MGDIPVTVVDVVVVVVLFVSGLLAFARGFVHEVLAVVGWIGAAFAAVYGYPFAMPYAKQLVGDDRVAAAASGIIIFLVALVLLSLLTRAIAQQVRDSDLGVLDRSLGFVFGLARGAVLVCLLFIGVQFLLRPQQQPTWLRAARTMPLIESGASVLKSLFEASPALQQPATAATDARDKARRALETERMVRDMMTPAPKAPVQGDGAEKKGYDEKVRREIDRLIDSSQGAGR